MELWEGILLSLAGGVMLGISTAAWLHTSGQVTGISGFLRGLIDPAKWKENRSMWRPAWLAAFVSTAAVLSIVEPDWFGKGDRADGTLFSYILGGFFVGLGTSMGNGCTSGHGICGLARFSLRSLTAVLTFMMAAMLTATTIDIHKPAFLVEVPSQVPEALQGAADVPNSLTWEFSAAYAGVTGALALGLIAAAWRYHGAEEGHHTAAAAGAGLLFSGGMAVGGMMNRSVILSFLALTNDWNPRLAFVMGGGVGVSILAFHYVNVRHAAAATCPYEAGAGELSSDFTEDERKAMTFLGRAYKVPSNTLINFQLVMGALLFGVGWGMSGFCPGPALGVMAGGAARSWLWLPGFAMGVGVWIALEHWLASKAGAGAPKQAKSTPRKSTSSGSLSGSPVAVLPSASTTTLQSNALSQGAELDAAGRKQARRLLKHALALLGEEGGSKAAEGGPEKAEHTKRTPLLSADAVGDASCSAATFEALQAYGDGTSAVLCAALRVAALTEQGSSNATSAEGSRRGSAVSMGAAAPTDDACGCESSEGGAV